MFPPSIKGLLYYFLLVKSISTCKIEYAGDTTFGSFEKSSLLSYFFQNMLHKPLIKRDAQNQEKSINFGISVHHKYNIHLIL